MNIARIIVAATVGSWVASVGLAAAQSVEFEFEVQGQAEAISSNARVAALDDAFGNAVNAALDELVAPSDLVTQKAVLDKEIRSRARLWVASFTVQRDREESPWRKLHVAVRIDRGKLEAKLAALSITLQQAEPTTPAGAKLPGVLLTAVAVGRVHLPGHDDIDIGSPASVGVFGQLDQVMSSKGWQLQLTEAREPGGWPITDDKARQIAALSGVSAALIAKISISPESFVRGAGAATVARARLRLVYATGQVNAADESQVSVGGTPSLTSLFASAATVLLAAPVIDKGLSRPVFGGEATELTPPQVARTGPAISPSASNGANDLVAGQVTIPSSSSDIRTVLVMAAPGQVVTALASSIGGRLESVLPNGYVVRVRKAGNLLQLASAVRQFAAGGRFVTQTKGEMIVARWETAK